jgi:DNA-binding beta-propeller fold protein YncE
MESSFYWPNDVVFTPTRGTFIVDYNNHRIRHLTAQQNLQTVIGADNIGDGPPDQSDLIPPGAPGTDCRLNHPTRLVELRHGAHAGEILLTAWHNHKLRRWNPDTGYIFVTIGRGAGYQGDGQDATESGRLNQPQHAIEASDGSIFILDQRNQVIRKIDPSNVITTVAGKRVLDTEGNALGGYNGDGLDPMETRFNFESGGNPQPSGSIALDIDGNLFVADVMNHVIRKIDWNAGIVTIVAGQAQSAGYSGDGGPATQARMNGPMDMEWGPDGRLYVAEKYNHVVRAIDLDAGTISTVVGTGIPGFSGDGGPATQAQIDSPHGIAFDAAGDLYVVDTNNHRIRKVHMP